MASIQPGTYYIVSAADTGFQVEGAGWNRASLRDGTTVQLIGMGYADGRIWDVSYREDGTLQMLNRLVGKSIEAAGENRYVKHAAGGNVQIWTDHDGPNQRWVATDANSPVTVGGVSYPTFYLKLKEEELRMAASAKPANRVNVVLASASATGNLDRHRWAFVPVPPITSGAVYKLVSYADSRTQLAVYSGWQKQNGNGVGACAMHDEWNDQKWLLEDTGDGWTLWNLEAERYAVVKDAAIKAKQPTIAWTAGGENKLWSIAPYGTARYEGREYPVVAFGAANGSTYALEANGTSTAFIDTWGDGIEAQRWILVPTYGFDGRLSAPYDLRSVREAGSRAEYAPTDDWGPEMGFEFAPYWKCAPALATSGGTSFQYRSRSRLMPSDTSSWDDWGGWSEWATAPAMRDGDEWWLSKRLSLSYTDACKLGQVECEVRTCVAFEADGKSSLRYGATASLVQTCYPVPSAEFGASALTAGGVEVAFGSSYGCGSTVLDIESIKSDGTEMLAGPLRVVVSDGEGGFIIPLASLADVPEDGSALEIGYGIGTDQGAPLRTGLAGSTSFVRSSYEQQVSDAPGMVRRAEAGAVAMWVTVEGRRIECPMNPDGTFDIAYPFGVPYDVYAVSEDGALWHEHSVGERGMHVWNWDGGYAAVELREGKTLETNDTITAHSAAYALNARPYEAVTFSGTRSHEFTVEGAVVGGVTESTRADFELLAGTHCTYRSPAGDIAKVAVTSVTRSAHRRWAEISVKMTREA